MTEEKLKHIKIFILIFVFSLTIVGSVNAEELNERLKGKILLQVEDVGQAWYVNPENKERAFLGEHISELNSEIQLLQIELENKLLES